MKKGWRFLVFAESFSTKILKENSIMVGAIINGISYLEDFKASLIKLYGLDATEKAIEIYYDLDREDINFIIFSGVIIALYNIIDLNAFYKEIKKPVIALSYRESEGIENTLRTLPESEERIRIYKNNGERMKIRLTNGFSLYIRSIGIATRDASKIINKITIHGKIPEPVKITKSIARGILNSYQHICCINGEIVGKKN